MTEQQPGYEADTTAVRPIVIILVLTAIGVPLASLALWVGLQMLRKSPAPAAGTPTPGVLREQPQLQTNPPAEYDQYHQRQVSRLHSLGWVDRDAGLVHIPIEEAMTRLVTRGLPEEDQPPPGGSAP